MIGPCKEEEMRYFDSKASLDLKGKGKAIFRKISSDIGYRPDRQAGQMLVSVSKE